MSHATEFNMPLHRPSALTIDGAPVVMGSMNELISLYNKD
jgi:hypothetical protein